MSKLLPADHSSARATRRDFLHTSGGLALAGALPGAWAAGPERVRLGLIGCGGRGTGATLQALRADPRVQLVAMADAFTDKLESHRTALLEALGEAGKQQVDVPAERRFVGFDAYRELLDSGVDAVVLATSPHFRPLHVEAAVAAGVHAFIEKPVAVDAPGVRRIARALAAARQRGLSMVSGLCWRYDDGMRATFARMHEGGVGRIVAMRATYNTSGLWSVARQEGWSDMEWQMRNWLYFTWLSGDHITEQHIHSLDKMAWAMGDRYPVRAWGVGGRQVRTQPKFGHIYDHFSICYEWDDGVQGFGTCRQQTGCDRDVSDWVFGSEGTCDVFGHEIRGERPWRYEQESPDMYQAEQNAWVASILNGEPIDDSHHMVGSTMMAILGRMAGYTGQTLTWEQALASKEDLTPKSYTWGPLPVGEVAMPGITEFF